MAVCATTALLGAACGGDNGDAEAAPSPTVAIAAAPTATDVPAATPTPEPTTVPTAPASATATPEPETSDAGQADNDQADNDEAAAIRAAWERYLDLSIQARGKTPSPESLDFDTYVTGDGAENLANAASTATYAIGSVMSTAFSVSIEDGGSARVSDCVDVQLEWRSRQDDSLDFAEQRLASSEGRLERGPDGWRVAAFRSDGGSRCDEF